MDLQVIFSLKFGIFNFTPRTLNFLPFHDHYAQYASFYMVIISRFVFYKSCKENDHN